MGEEELERVDARFLQGRHVGQLGDHDLCSFRVIKQTAEDTERKAKYGSKQ